MTRAAVPRSPLLLLPVLALAFCLLGCGRRAPPTAGSSPAPPVTISVAFWDLTEFGSDPLGKRIEDALGIRLRIMLMDWDNYEEQARLWAATDSLPDVLATYTVEQDHVRLFNWVDQGLLRTIPDELIDRHPRVRELFSGNEIERVISSIRGAHLFIPRPFSLKGYYRFDQGRGVYYRRDWLKAVGMREPPRTIPEFRAMARAFTFDDPDGDGVANTWGVTCTAAPGTSFAWWGVMIDGWMQEGGQWIPGFLSRRNADVLAFWGSLYEEGVLDPKFAEDSMDQSLHKFAAGRHGVCFKNVDNYWLAKVARDGFARTYLGTDDVAAALECVDVLPPLSASAGVAPLWPAITESSGSEISAKVDDAKLDRILDLFDWLGSPDASRLLHYGIAGVDYVEEQGAPRVLSDGASAQVVDIVRKYPSAQIEGLLTWDADYWIEDPRTPEGIRLLGERVRKLYNPIARQENWTVRLAATPPAGQDWPDVSHDFALMILQGSGAAGAFRAWRQQMLDGGFAEVIARANRALASAP